MATVKTVVLTAGTETVIACDGGRHTNVENKTTGTVYVSRFSGVVADADEVYAIAPGQRKLIFDCEGTAYALATVSGSVEIMGTNFANANFKSAGGEGVNSSATAGDLSLSATLNYKDKWLDCHGQNVSRDDFPELFAQIGTAYGVGNGVDTFGLPDTEDLTTSDTARYNIYTGVSNSPLQIKCNAGTFSATVSGFTNPVWRYKDTEITGDTGTFTIENDGDVVRFSGVATSTPQFTCRTAGRPYFATDLKDFQGVNTYHLDLHGCTNVTGDLSDLQGKITRYLDLHSCANITGDLSDLQGNLSFYLNLCNCSNITGDLSDLQGNLTSQLDLSNCTHITGDLSGLQDITRSLELYNCTGITGDLADLQGNLTTYLSVTRCLNIAGVYTPVENSTIKQMYFNNSGQTSADIDATIIAVAENIAADNTNGALVTDARTSASDSAVASLKAKGWTVKCGGVVQ